MLAWLLLAAAPAIAADDADWPCVQRLVLELSAAQMWSGPPLDTVEGFWQADPLIAPLVLDLIDLDVEQAAVDERVRAFATKIEPADREARLPLLFKAVLATVNGERAQMIGGIKRYAAKQKALADRIAADNAALRGVRLDVEPDAEQQELLAVRERRDWDLRVFDDRLSMLPLICEQPVLLEQRAFALARTIQGELP